MTLVVFPDEVNWNMVYQRYWKDTINDMDRQGGESGQAEFLVHQ